MSQSKHDGEPFEVQCSLGDLRITIAGPRDQATALLLRLTSEKSEESTRSPRTEGSFDLVSSVPSEVQNSENRCAIASSFLPCPRHLLAQSTRLSGSSTSGEDRIRRAWTAGQWAGAVQAGRISTPNRSQQLDLRPRYYAIIKAQNLDSSTLCKSAASYWGIIEEMAKSNSISHSFPSEIEAQVYFAGAGVIDFEIRQ
jgi:hypothetical protein